MNRIGIAILFLAILLGSSCKSQNFYWSHTYVESGVDTCFGYLYNWYTIVDTREVTSSADWSVSSYSQLSDLRTYAGGQSDAGVKLKSTSNLFWDVTTGHTNELGLTLLGSGYRYDVDGVFENLRIGVIIAGDNGTKWQGFSIAGGNASMSIGVWEAETGLSIRLTKDATGIADGVTTTYTGNDGKTYNAIVINQLYWTTENLEETLYRNLDPIPNVTDNATWAGLATGAWCVYDNNDSYKCK